MSLPLVPILLATCLLALAPDSRGSGIDFDPQPGSAAMGGATGAAWWTADPNHWANPSLLAFHDGIRFAHSNQVLTFSDATFETDHATAGWGGIGLFLAGRPGEAFGRTRLRVPESSFFATLETHTHQWGVGLSAAGLTRQYAGWRRVAPPRWTRTADLALGYTARRIDVLQGTPLDTGHAHDLGVLARVTAFEVDRGPGPLALPARLDLAYGWSSQNAGGTRWDREDLVGKANVRNAVSSHFALGIPRGWGEGRLGWLLRSFDPLVSLGGGYDFYDLQGVDTRLWGGQLTVANVLALRIGYVDDPKGGIEGESRGWGLGFRIADVGAFRYDRASIPQGASSENRDQSGYSVHVDPVALWKLARGGEVAR